MRRRNVVTCWPSSPSPGSAASPKAGKKLGVSQSALSHTIKGLEERLGLRLLTRTTRSVSPTEAGERLLATVGPRFEEIEAELEALSELRDKPAGTIRITPASMRPTTILCPAWRSSCAVSGHQGRDHHRLRSDRHRRGALRRRRALGEQVAKDMIAVRIGPDMRMAVVGAPSYFEKRPRAEDAAGPDGAQLHQSAPADLWRPVCVGIRAKGGDLRAQV